MIDTVDPYLRWQKSKTYDGGVDFDLTQNLSLVDSYGNIDEFVTLRNDYQGASFTINQKPELLSQKTILEAIRKTGRTNILALEHEGSNGFVVQISDVCIKFKNRDSDANFLQEAKNHKLIETLYHQFSQTHDCKKFFIAGLQRHLCSTDYIAIEYIPGLTLSLQLYLQEQEISLQDLYSFLYEYHSTHNDLDKIYHKVQAYGYTTLKEYDYRMILYHIDSKHSDNLVEVMHRDKKEVIAAVTNDHTIYKLYQQRKKYLRENGITFIDDHNDNLKYIDGILYSFDFGNLSQRHIPLPIS